MKVWKERSKHSCVTPFPGETPLYTLVAKDTCTRRPCQPGIGDRGWDAHYTLLGKTEGLGVRGGSGGALTLLVEVSHPLTDFLPLWRPGLAFSLLFSALSYCYTLFLTMQGQRIISLVELCSPDLHSCDSE